MLHPTFAHLLALLILALSGAARSQRFYVPGIFEALFDEERVSTTVEKHDASSSVVCNAAQFCKAKYAPGCRARVRQCRHLLQVDRRIAQPVWPWLYENETLPADWSAYPGIRTLAFDQQLQHQWLAQCRESSSSAQPRSKQFLSCLTAGAPPEACASIDARIIDESLESSFRLCKDTSTTGAVNDDDDDASQAIAAQRRCVVGFESERESDYERGLAQVERYLRVDSPNELIRCLAEYHVDYGELKLIHSYPRTYEREFCAGLEAVMRCAYRERCGAPSLERLVRFGLEQSILCTDEHIEPHHSGASIVATAAAATAAPIAAGLLHLVLVGVAVQNC